MAIPENKSTSKDGPALSIVVVAYRMPRQLRNTLLSLSVPYQQNVSEQDYEVIVLENQSSENLDQAYIDQLDENFSFIKRHDSGVSPAPAINEGISLAKGRYICLMIDGARIASPGLVANAIQACTLVEYPLVTLPAYMLGDLENYRTLGEKYRFEIDQSLLQQVDWTNNGYRLFNISYFSFANPFGYFHPIMESNCLCARKDSFDLMGGVDERFDLAGGGMINLDIYRRLAELENHRLFLLYGEGTFHQYHGGTTTSGKVQKAFSERMHKQYVDLRKLPFKSILREPVLLGKPKLEALPFLIASSITGTKRFERFKRLGKDEWPDEKEQALNSAKTEAAGLAPLKLSVLVIAYNMPDQLANTLYSLSSDYQRGILFTDYEVIVVENESDNCLPVSARAALPANFHYFSKPNDSVSPATAIQFGLQYCRGEFLGVIIDGAQMVTPRALQFATMALKQDSNALVALPGYHLGEVEQHLIDDHEKFELEQNRFLATSGWRENGYRLFDWACFSPGNRRGYLQPMMESSGFFCTRQRFMDIGGADPRFDSAGGGSLNLHMYRSLGLLASSSLFVLPGEGSFHQYHGGVTTGQADEYESTVRAFNIQLQEIWQDKFQALRREPQLLGAIGASAQRFLLESAKLGERRLKRLLDQGDPLWIDDIN